MARKPWKTKAGRKTFSRVFGRAEVRIRHAQYRQALASLRRAPETSSGTLAHTFQTENAIRTVANAISQGLGRLSDLSASIRRQLTTTQWVVSSGLAAALAIGGTFLLTGHDPAGIIRGTSSVVPGLIHGAVQYGSYRLFPSAMAVPGAAVSTALGTYFSAAYQNRIGRPLNRLLDRGAVRYQALTGQSHASTDAQLALLQREQPNALDYRVPDTQVETYQEPELTLANFEGMEDDFIEAQHQFQANRPASSQQIPSSRNDSDRIPNHFGNFPEYQGDN